MDGFKLVCKSVWYESHVLYTNTMDGGQGGLTCRSVDKINVARRTNDETPQRATLSRNDSSCLHRAERKRATKGPNQLELGSDAVAKGRMCENIYFDGLFVSKAPISSLICASKSAELVYATCVPFT
jgi:hypothetical protein